MDSSRFSALLKQLHHDDGGPIQVVADNAKYRHSKATGRFVEEQGDPKLVYLPPYLPELNPDEQVWNHANRGLGKRTILCGQALEGAVFNILRSLQKQKERVRSFFRLPGTRYLLSTQ